LTNRFLVDALTKYVFFHHTLKIGTVVCLFGVPTRIIADQGSNFASLGFRESCASRKIVLHLMATGASIENGQV